MLLNREELIEQKKSAINEIDVMAAHIKSKIKRIRKYPPSTKPKIIQNREFGLFILKCRLTTLLFDSLAIVAQPIPRFEDGGKEIKLNIKK